MSQNFQWNHDMPFEEVRAILTKMRVTDKDFLDEEFVPGTSSWEISAAGSLCAALGGMLLGVEIQLDIQQGEIRSFALGGMVGPLLAALSCLIESLGRLGFLYLGGIGFCIGAAVQRFFPSQDMLPDGACISGAAAGVLCASIPIYLGEVSHPDHRGAMVAAFQLAIAFGLILTSCVNVWFDPSETSSDVIMLVLAGLLTAGVSFLPNSYRWLVSRRQFKEALSLARRTCSSRQDVRLEIAMCQREFRRQTATGKANWVELLSGVNLKALAIGVVLQLLQQLCGFVYFLLHGSQLINEVFQSSGGFSFTPWFVTANLLGTIPGMLLVDRVGRKKMLLFSALTMMTCCFILAAAGSCTTVNFASAVDASECGEGTKAVIAGAILLHTFAFAFGWGPITWIYCAEIFPLKYRSKASGLVTCAHWVGFYSVVRASELLLPSLGFHKFWIFAVFNALGAFASVVMPETKQETLEEIQLIFDPWLRGEETTRQVVICGQADSDHEWQEPSKF
mmetsp:Transcript_44318/g.103575  ORF Transcript_44318/g.103575 Transcript_44318/m.103575 type:complete len:507 (+) Transcript_44318:43-1563(+)